MLNKSAFMKTIRLAILFFLLPLFIACKGDLTPPSSSPSSSLSITKMEQYEEDQDFTLPSDGSTQDNLIQDVTKQPSAPLNPPKPPEPNTPTSANAELDLSPKPQPQKTKEELEQELRKRFKSNDNAAPSMQAQEIKRTNIFYDKSTLNAFKEFKKPNSSNNSASASLSFDKDWSQGFNGRGIKIAVLDVETVNANSLNNHSYYFDKASVNVNYYGNNFNDGRTIADISIDSSELKTDAESIKSAKQTENISNLEKNLLMDYYLNPNNFKEGKNNNLPIKLTHATQVARTITWLYDSPTIYSARASISGDLSYNSATLINGYANHGVRIFNRSYYSGNGNSTSDLYAYAPAIMYRNALFINSAGNDNSKSQPVNFLPQESKLRDGWIVVAGYNEVAYIKGGDEYIGNNKIPMGVNKAKIKDSIDKFYAKSLSGNANIYLASNPCGVAKLDCVVAPFIIVNNKGDGIVSSNQYFSGTSAGAPMTSALAAAILEKYPWMSNSNIKDSILTTAIKVTDSKGSQIQDDIDDTWGWGILDTSRAMNGPARFYEKDFIANINVLTLNQDQDKRTSGDYNFISSFNNDINGNQGLIKRGNGWLLLNGVNTYSGATKIESGGLWINKSIKSPITIGSNGTLRGQDTLFNSIDNNGVFFSDGNATIEGEYKQSADAILKINFGNKLTVGGNALLNGELNFVGYLTNAPMTYDVITATKLIGTFSAVKSSSPLIDNSTIKTNYKNNLLEVTAQRTSASSHINNESILISGANNLESLFREVDKSIYKIALTDEDIGKLGDYELAGGHRTTDFKLKNKDELKALSAQNDDDNNDRLMNELVSLFTLNANDLNTSIYTQGGSIYANAILFTSLDISKIISKVSKNVRQDDRNSGSIVSLLSVNNLSKYAKEIKANNISASQILTLAVKNNGYFIGLSMMRGNQIYKEEFKNIKDKSNGDIYSIGFNVGYSDIFIIYLDSFYTYMNNNVTRNIKTNNNYRATSKARSLLFNANLGVGIRSNLGAVNYSLILGYAANLSKSLPFVEHSESLTKLQSNGSNSFNHGSTAELSVGFNADIFHLYASSSIILDVSKRSIVIPLANQSVEEFKGNAISVFIPKLRYSAGLHSKLEFNYLSISLAYDSLFFTNFISHSLDASITIVF